MKKIITLALLVSPLSTFAAVTGNIDTVDSIFQKFSTLGDAFVTILISLSVVWIIFNVVRYLIAGSEEDRKKGGMAILYGVVGLFVILSIWGLVYILKRTFVTTDTQVQNRDIPKTLDPSKPLQ